MTQYASERCLILIPVHGLSETFFHDVWRGDLPFGLGAVSWHRPGGHQIVGVVAGIAGRME